MAAAVREPSGVRNGGKNLSASSRPLPPAEPTNTITGYTVTWYTQPAGVTALPSVPSRAEEGQRTDPGQAGLRVRANLQYLE